MGICSSKQFEEPQTKPQIRTGKTAIDLYEHRSYRVSDNLLTFKGGGSMSASVTSFPIGAAVARMTLNVKKGQLLQGMNVGIVSTKYDHIIHDRCFPDLAGGAAWNLRSEIRGVTQNMRQSNIGTACSEVRVGQRIVLEADGREGKRTLKLSLDGVTQPVYFTNIPVPFRLAFACGWMKDVVEVESVEIVSEPQMEGGTTPAEMDGTDKGYRHQLVTVQNRNEYGVVVSEESYVEEVPLRSGWP
ncbi:hypothetical protein BLNAU_8539 [Blattamonas nauphoetae]|uniref:Uncharacterized protein n=1 Tax=Blattamonas nauphoetae TaxID=2049346 RepID=A0ABQ9XYE9_9EUKA|nr:hypothetical protein BLNAU_8539 [Blattamonas nauphoetae]